MQGHRHPVQASRVGPTEEEDKKPDWIRSGEEMPVSSQRSLREEEPEMYMKFSIAYYL